MKTREVQVNILKNSKKYLYDAYTMICKNRNGYDGTSGLDIKRIQYLLYMAENTFNNGYDCEDKERKEMIKTFYDARILANNLEDVPCDCKYHTESDLLKEIKNALNVLENKVVALKEVEANTVRIAV